ncbi:hypothetical protein GTO27_09720 [Candidatus Bathyarchaeota archaeon]|nr:hypothetical protein [Candidatus Bathyarchaeota archaeon]
MLEEAWMLSIESLSWMQMRRLSERLALGRTIRQLNIRDSNAIRLAHRLVVETVRRQNFIDKFVNCALRPKAIKEFSLGVQAFLRLYVYHTRIARNWSKIDVTGAENAARYARSILGWRTIRKIEHVLGLLLTQKPSSVLIDTSDEEKIGLLTFHPTWFVKYCFKLFGRIETLSMLESNSHAPPTYIRLNTLRADEAEILETLTKEGLEVLRVEQLRHTYIVGRAKRPLTRTQSFRSGFFYIQDKASCFAVEAADPKPGMTVLDVCAAPGAKTTYLAQLMQNHGAVYSIDHSKRRMGLWKNEVARMGVNIATPIIVDGYNSLPLKAEADVVVLDPPCTSTGVFGRLPSAKWRLHGRSIDRMAKLQWEMLGNCAEHVKPNGILYYSTCSITVEENEMLIQRFLKWHPEFTLAEIEPKIGLPGLRGLKECRRLYPHLHLCNGFFMAKLSKDQVSK